MSEKDMDMRLQRDLEHERARRAEATVAALEEAVRVAHGIMPDAHFECDDSFYSCSAHPGRLDYNLPPNGPCDCGYDNVEKWRARPVVQAALAKGGE